MHGLMLGQELRFRHLHDRYGEVAKGLIYPCGCGAIGGHPPFRCQPTAAHRQPSWRRSRRTVVRRDRHHGRRAIATAFTLSTMFLTRVMRKRETFGSLLTALCLGVVAFGKGLVYGFLEAFT